jgi:hypothetical protein
MLDNLILKSQSASAIIGKMYAHWVIIEYCSDDVVTQCGEIIYGPIVTPCMAEQRWL